MYYYRSTKSTQSYSSIEKLGGKSTTELNLNLTIKDFFKVDILAFYLMPTHFHFVLKQRLDNGISNFLSKISNSFTRYFNIKNQRKGQIFLKDFKSVLVRSDEQLLHTVRYVHLNGYSSKIDSNIDAIDNIRSSHGAYINLSKDGLVSTTKVLGYFQNSRARYNQFIVDSGDYQRSLEELKQIIKYENNEIS